MDVEVDHSREQVLTVRQLDIYGTAVIGGCDQSVDSSVCVDDNDVLGEHLQPIRR